MFEKLKNKLKKLQESMNTKVSLDLAQFNDPLTEKVDWGALKPGGANFKTKTLKMISPSVYKYQLSTGGKFFIGIFALIGLIALIVGLLLLLDRDYESFIFPIIFGSIFSVVSYFMYRFMGTPMVFDRNLGFIWSGRKQPQLSGNSQQETSLIYFSDVYAIQIISERVTSKNSSYFSYEINLVLKDAKRVNVVDHGNHSQIILDAEKLSELLGKPIWDVS